MPPGAGTSPRAFAPRTLFGLLALLHIWRTMAEWSRLGTDPWYVIGVAAIGVAAGALSIWAWKLLPGLKQRE